MFIYGTICLTYVYNVTYVQNVYMLNKNTHTHTDAYVYARVRTHTY